MKIFILIFVSAFSWQSLAQNKSCNSNNPSNRAEQCMISKTASDIETCCNSDGAAFCGYKGCVCYRGVSKSQRLSIDTTGNFCSLAKISENSRDPWGAFVSNVQLISNSYKDNIRLAQCNLFLFEVQILQEQQAKLPESRAKSSNVYMDRLIFNKPKFNLCFLKDSHAKCLESVVPTTHILAGMALSPNEENLYERIDSILMSFAVEKARVYSMLGDIVIADTNSKIEQAFGALEKYLEGSCQSGIEKLDRSHLEPAVR